MEGHAVIIEEIQFQDSALTVQHWVGEGFTPDHVELRMLANRTFQADLQESVYDLDFEEIQKLHHFLGQIIEKRRAEGQRIIAKAEADIKARKAALLRDLDD